MNKQLKKDADKIIEESIKAVLPDEAVERALLRFQPPKGKLVLVAVGKAAWQMANAAKKVLDCDCQGIVITKYDHIMGEIPGIDCYEAGHPVPDVNGFEATEKILEMVKPLGESDEVLFLLSGGGSALFESPLIEPEELASITKALLASGADIVEMNTVRKRLSGVKGGRFALSCAPAKVFSIVLSDVLGDPLDMIASGPAYPDTSTSKEAIEIVRRYGIPLSDEAWKLLGEETPKSLDNVETHITGSVRQLCEAAARSASSLGYEPVFLTDELSCEAKEAGKFLASILRSRKNTEKRIAFIAGGETVVHLTGKGMGGRNQELALAAAEGIAGIENAAVFSLGSDGTDGPTDAAGGYVDGDTLSMLKDRGISLHETLKNNDAYHALKAVNGLIVTGPTGTNVNDVSIALLDLP